MALNEVHPYADDLSLPVPDGTAAGSPVIVGATIVGVTQTKEGTGGNPDNYATVRTRGSHKLSVTGAVTAIGDPVYITSGNALNRTASGNTLFGYALELKGAPAGVITVKIARV